MSNKDLMNMMDEYGTLETKEVETKKTSKKKAVVNTSAFDGLGIEEISIDSFTERKMELFNVVLGDKQVLAETLSVFQYNKLVDGVEGLKKIDIDALKMDDSYITIHNQGTVILRILKDENDTTSLNFKMIKIDYDKFINSKKVSRVLGNDKVCKKCKTRIATEKNLSFIQDVLKNENVSEEVKDELNHYDNCLCMNCQKFIKINGETKALSDIVTEANQQAREQTQDEKYIDTFIDNMDKDKCVVCNAVQSDKDKERCAKVKYTEGKPYCSKCLRKLIESNL